MAMLNNQMIYSNSSGFIPPIFDDPIFDDLYHPFTVNLGMRIVVYSNSWSTAFIWPCVFVHIGGVGWGGVGHVLTFM